MTIEIKHDEIIGAVLRMATPRIDILMIANAQRKGRRRMYSTRASDARPVVVRVRSCLGSVEFNLAISATLWVCFSPETWTTF